MIPKFTETCFYSRSDQDTLADLQEQVAALKGGEAALRESYGGYGEEGYAGYEGAQPADNIGY